MDWRLDTIAVRITLAIVFGILLFLSASLAFAIIGDVSEEAISQMLPARIGAAVNVIETAPPADQPRLVRALATGSLAIELRDGPLPELAEEHGPRAALLRLRVQTGLGRSRAKVIVGRAPTPEVRAYEVTVAVGLPDGRWLLFASPDDMLRLAPFERYASRLGLFCLFMGAISVWASRRLAKSIADFAAAAERLGVDSSGPPLIEHGPRELRAAIRAFNRMQARLRRFVDDRTQMLAAMSHDLRTPLTRLRMRAEFVEDDEERQKMLSDLDAMSAMVSSTLSFARDDTQREQRMLVDLAILVEDICEDAADLGADVSFSGPSRIDLACRPVALRRAVGNLVDNAIKYGGYAHVAVAQEEDCVAVSVEDGGPGIPEAEQEKVFAPFYRLDPSRNRDTGGVGLGLAVARTIAREHGGDVALRNREGGGLRVRLTLPL